MAAESRLKPAQPPVKKRTALSFAVTEQLLQAGFPEEFAQLVGSELNTDFTAAMMLGYIRDGKPRKMEEVVDEMLGILQFRDKCMRRQIMLKTLYDDAQW